MPIYIKEYDVYERLRIEAHYSHTECEKILQGIRKADVVPRSEVEEAKQEVAREILTHIKKHIGFHEKLYGNIELHPVVSEFKRGATTVTAYFDELIAEIEKKYIGE